MSDQLELGDDIGVASNSRLTATLGAVLIVVLAIEGVTLLDVSGLFAWHAFVGLLVIPIVALKLASTGFRFYRYYTGDAAYRRRGPPHPILRILAPVVVVATIALLATGVALLAVGPDDADTLITLHQASFIVWVSATAIHVLGHLRETWRLTRDDLRVRTARAVPRVGRRRALVSLSVLAGLALGVGSLSWNHSWTHRAGGRDHEDGLVHR